MVLCLLSTKELLYVIGYKDQHLLNLIIMRTWVSTLETWIKCAVLDMLCCPELLSGLLTFSHQNTSSLDMDKEQQFYWFSSSCHRCYLESFK